MKATISAFVCIILLASVSILDAQSADTTPPSVQMTGPSSGAYVRGSLSVTATASDNVGVASVQFMLDGTSNIGTQDTSSPYSKSWNTTTASNGPHVVSARARDAAGNSATSTVTVTVDNQAPPPGTIAINGGATATNNRTVTLSLSASDPVSPITQMRFSNSGSSFSGTRDYAPTTSWQMSSGAGTKTVYVQFKDAAGNWSSASSDTIVYETTAPTVSNRTATGITATNATITWTTNEAADSQVEYGPTTAYGFTTLLDPSLLTAHSVLLSNLSPSTLYNYRVRSRDAAGNLATSANSTFTTLAAPDTSPPSIPTNLNATAVSSSQINLTWNASTDNVGVTGYKVFRGGVQIATTTSTSLNNTGLASETLYSYTVSAFDAAGNVSAASQAASATTLPSSDTTPPSAPVLTATAVSQSQIDLSWSASTDNVGVAGYRIKRDGVHIATTTQLAYADTGRASSTQYAYVVTAFDAAGNATDSNTSLATTFDPPPPPPPGSSSVSLSADGRYLVDQSGNPFFLNGDTAWSLIVQLTNEDAELYLENRRQKGYNFALVNLIDTKFSTNAPNNIYNQAPFTTPNNFATPNEAYFAHADWVINKAQEKGIIVLLNPLYLGYTCGSEGWCTAVQQNSLAQMREYGRFLGNRYKNNPNIIWMLGADMDPQAYGVADKVREVVAGIQEYDTAHLVSAHNDPGSSARDRWPSETWLDLNNIYNYGDIPPDVFNEYNKTPYMPIFMMETAYENEHSSTPLSLRRQNYHAVLSGAYLGHIFGNCPIWGFGSPVGSSFCSQVGTPWQNWLDSPGSVTLAHLGTLMQSRAFHLLVPDQNHTVMTAGFQSGTTYAATSRASDGSSVIAYIPTQRAVTIDMTKVAGSQAHGWWYNPRTAQATDLGLFPTTGTRQFTPPDSNDWVLVLDNAALNLPAPGGNPLPPTPTVSLDASPTTVAFNTTTTLSWTSANVTSCTASGGWSGAKGTSGSEISANLTSDQTFILECTGSFGTVNDSVSVTVVQPDTSPPSIPTNLNATAVSSSQINLTWSASSDNVGVTGYKVFRGGVQIATTTSTSFNDTGLAPATLYTYAVSAFDAMGNTSAQSTSANATTQAASSLPTAGLVASWSFDEGSGSSAADATGNNHTGTLVNGPTWVAGKIGSALQFDGSNDYVDTAGESAFDFTGAFSVSLWMKRSNFTNEWEAIVHKADSAWGIARFGSSDSITFNTWSASTPHDLGSSATLDNNQWRHVVVVYTGTQKLLYVDGQLNASANYSSTLRTNNFNVRFGMNEEYAPAMYGGALDQVRIYNRALTPAEVTSLFNE